MSQRKKQKTKSATSVRAQKKRYNEDFKRNAVQLVVAESYSFKAAALAVGVSEKSLRDWHQKYGPASGLYGDDATIEQLRDENKRLRKQLRHTEMEREILKKATAYFAKESS